MIRIIGNILFIRISYFLYSKSLLRQRRQKGDGGLMYFCIAFPNGLVLLKELVVQQKVDDYKTLFNTFIVSAIRLNIGILANLAQVNYRIHISRGVRECHEKNDINIIDWPSRSPYLNIVENIWKMISN